MSTKDGKHDPNLIYFGAGFWPIPVIPRRKNEMGITYGDHLIDSGYYDITAEEERERDDAAMGMTWWNAMDDKQRNHWMEIAGNTGCAVDAWRAFKAHTDLQ